MAGHSIDEESMGPLERGRSRYQQRNWSGAVEAFSEVIKLTTGNLQFTALDHRAATYEKMGELQSALRDSKRMIDSDPNLAKGYLRCAKVLQLKGEKDLALKIYERGLRKVKIGTDHNRTTLQSMHNKLRQAQDPGKSLDPLNFLPLELAQMIIENLEMRDRVICLAVSPPWKRLLESSHKLWTTFDISRARKPVNKHSLKLHLCRSNYTLNSAIISMGAKFDEDKLTYLTKTCKQLKRLEIKGNGVIGDSLVAALPLARNLSCLTVCVHIHLGVVLFSLETCQKTLVEAAFTNIQALRSIMNSSQWPTWPRLESLKSLILEAPSPDPGEQPIDLTGLLDSIPNIQSLSLRGWHLPNNGRGVHFNECKHLEYLDLSSGSMHHFPALPRTLKSLDLSKNYSLGLYLEQPDETYDLPLLESLKCESTCISGVSLNALILKSVKSGNLKRLDISRTNVDPDTYSPGSSEYLASPTVEELSLAGLTSNAGTASMLGERHIIAIVKCYPNVKELDVSRTKVTGVAVKEFVSMGIKWLNLSECTEVGRDAVEYAQGKGVEVEFKFPSRCGRTTFRELYN